MPQIRILPILVAASIGALWAAGGCSLAVTRPVQDMSNTAAAIRAAREVQADTRAPELFRQANEWFFRAKQEYKLKNFKEAKNYAAKARRFAEEAEFESLNSGANRISAPPDPFATDDPRPKRNAARPPLEQTEPPPKPTEEPGIYSESFEAQEEFNKKVELQKAANPPTSNSTNITVQQPQVTTPQTNSLTPPATIPPSTPIR